ncbi:MAG: sigma-54-dependent Fis family transcriptional regulator [Ignavibacteriota bacterium]|jgi:DNA-binding NtrC family response regulator|nr:sigma-54-dependent Fis family transcriptional regulator [Ignavibacteriales bacterium]MBL1122038.1 sigma-54-dependent Fis family transcriptional regulator [Ignavibacteriota bacterium]MCC7093892.1 sigma-54-dependent Fis family transcriptional regulator [Ignavibacteriaceae bacterium]MCE7856108.1 sigma-54-dependent Fis family transcriptional regulator [Ignavibacteria bacterium CHB3]MEB2296762.1 sigma-54 dependent transcriptional regulator [Ignavibacteria bacterium]
MEKQEKILIVDDEKVIRESLQNWFEDDNYLVDTAENGEIALKKYTVEKYDLLLVDMKMPGMSGLDLLSKIKAIDKDALIILITAFASVPTAITALKNGAYDYVTKPIDPDELSHLVKRALEQKALKMENIQLKENIDEIIKPDNLIGESFQMKKILELVHTVAKTDTTVMIRGESGTGKELIAKAIHINSNRKYFPIITVNCGALAESLLESELFGHEKGSFTGAQFRRKGKFEMADRGTIFLDEIGSISLKMQVELLRVIESKQFNRVGGNDLIKSDFRVITATNEALEELVKTGKFREDLYYRLNVFSVVIPPLRERRDDIPLLANFFIRKFSTVMNKPVKTVSKEAMEFLINHDWPGNVRELENAIERAMVVGKSNSITVDDLPFHLSQINGLFTDDDKSLASMERKFILRTLNENNWNISKAAQLLEIDRVTLYNKIDKYSLRKAEY